MQRILFAIVSSAVVALAATPAITASANQGPPGLAFTATCTGPGSQSQQGSVAPGQTDNCSIALSTGSLGSGSTVLISVTSPSGVVMSSCTGGSAGGGSCTFFRPNGAFVGQTIGSESFQIPPSTVSGTHVQHSARVCDVFGCRFPPVVTGGLGAVVSGSGGIAPPPTPPSPPFVTATCIGPNPDQTVYAGQQVTCTVYPFDGNTFGTGQAVDLTLVTPLGSVLSNCSGVSSATSTTSAAISSSAARCRFTVTSGSVQRPAPLGSEVIGIAANAPANTPVSFTATYCTAPGSDGERVCTARPESVPVSGQGGIVSTDPPVRAAGINVDAVEGQAFNGAVATFSDADGNGSPAEYAASIDWGDGTGASTGTIEGWSVSGWHIYAEEGTYAVTVTIADRDTLYNQAEATEAVGLPQATVADAPLSATGRPVNSTNPFAGVLATFTDANGYGSVADYTATVDWGDGTTSDGSVDLGGLTASGSVFEVGGNHLYTDLGPYTIRIHICDDGGACADATSSILVYGLSTGGNFVVGDGDATVGSTTYFWGSEWASMNSLSGGTGEPSFKGFADNPNSSPACGVGWSTTPGNSAKPPDSVPSYLAVAVASSLSKQGPRIAGDSVQVVVIKTDASYGSDPGQPGTGTVVAVLCP